MAINPTGLNMGPHAPILPALGDANPMGPGNYNFGNTQNPNPSQPPTNQNPYSAAPGISTVTPFGGPPPVMNPPGAPGTGASGPPGAPPVTTVTGNQGQTTSTGNLFGGTQLQNNQMLTKLQSTYGSGLGQAIYDYLQTQGGFNLPLTEQTVQATNAAMEQNISKGEQNIHSTLGAEGISPNSSVSALETSNYLSNAMTQMNAIDANLFQSMWSQSSSQELSALENAGEGVGKYIANQPTGLTWFNSIFGALEGGVTAYENK